MPLDRRQLLARMQSDVRHPVSVAELAVILGLGRAEHGELKAVLRALARSGDLVRIKGGRYGLPRKMNLVVGELRCSAKGYGFVVPAHAGERDVFVRLPDMGGALHGDQVVARIERTRADGRVAGSVIRVLERAAEHLLGRFERGVGGYGFVVPIDPRILAEVVIAPGATRDAGDGQLVEVEVVDYPARGRDATGRVADVLGDADDAGIDLELVLRRHDLPRRFPDQVEAAAAAAPAVVDEADRRGRDDFRGRVVVTIDGEKARDFDDAVGAERTDDGFRVWVHIADVGHYVRPGSALDDEAGARSTSVYFPDHVIPMLPERLSNGICSLKPDEDRLTLTLVLELSGDGEVTGYRLTEGVIRSDARLTYNQVHAIVVERDPELAERYREVVPTLELLAEIADTVGGRRRARGSLDFDLPESEIVLDQYGAMTGIRRGQRLRSHDIIEELMIVANETVAGHFVEAGLPMLFRVHDPPDETEVETLNRALLAFGLRIEQATPKSFRGLLERVRGNDEEKFIHPVVLRTLKLARYSPDNSGHFGLASAAYCHFTSPIRRYPDLVVHRLVKEWLATGLDGDDRRAEAGAEVDAVAASGSRLARRAEDAEREYIERKKTRFMADKVGSRFTGIITAVETFGFFVELDEYFVDGLVHLTSLSDDYYRYDADRHRLLGENTGRRFRLGDRVTVEVAGVDMLRRRIDFTIAAAEE